MWIFEKGARGGKKNAQEKCPKKKWAPKTKKKREKWLFFGLLVPSQLVINVCVVPKNAVVEVLVYFSHPTRFGKFVIRQQFKRYGQTWTLFNRQ